MTVEEVTSRQVTRRKLLKRAGVTGAVLLAAPVVSSTASAGPNDPRLNRFVCKQGCEVGGDPCFGQRDCTNNDQNPNCSCLLTQAGRCFCHAFAFCSDLAPCSAAADCPEGWACASSCCSASPDENFCHPPCGVGGVARAAGGAKTSGG